jgi:hypothetical protein
MLTRPFPLIAIGALRFRADVLDERYTRTLAARASSQARRARRTGRRAHGDQALGDRALLERVTGELLAGQVTIEQCAAMMRVSTGELAAALQRAQGVVPVPPPPASR